MDKLNNIGVCSYGEAAFPHSASIVPQKRHQAESKDELRAIFQTTK